MLRETLWVFIGGGIGSIGRYWLAEGFARLVGGIFPWGTLVVNVSGCFLIGFFIAFTGVGGRLPVSSDVRLLVAVGICGGYTTFSAFSLQTLVLAQGGHVGRAAAYVAASVVLCLLAVLAGHLLATWLNQLRAA
jgi:CrcB protein